MNILEVKGLQKSFGNKKAVNNISFNVKEGDFFSFLGKNGAGKSTTINMIVSMLKKDSGTIKVGNNYVGENNKAIKNDIGVVFQNSFLDGELTVRENLTVRGYSYNFSKPKLKKRISELVEMLNMNDFIEQKYGTLSGGQKRLADVARALISHPKLLILDEPTTGLDPKIRVEIWNTINELKSKENITIFLTTHYMEETNTADKVIILDKGNIVAVGTPSQLKEKYTNTILKLTYKNETLLESQLKGRNIEYEKVSDEFIIKIESSFESINIINEFKENILEFEVIKGTMDDMFLNSGKGE